MRMRKIAVVSGKRGGFGAMLPLLKKIEDDPTMQLILIVTDQHLYKSFGSTVSEVEKWLPISYKVDLQQSGDSSLDRVQAIGNAVSQIGDVLNESKPDVLLILGDRGEILGSVIAAINLGIPVAHIQGGDVSGCVDEFVRHAITKMSHIHFPSTQIAANNILNMGEESWRVHPVGDCHIDEMIAGNFTSPEILSEKYDLDMSKPIFLVLQHSVTTEPEKSAKHSLELIEALKEFEVQSIIVYPCSDHGYQGIVDSIHLLDDCSWAKIHKNIEAYDFWGLQNIASAFIGNSSAGLIETPFFKLPSVTIGSRQQGRERSENAISVEPIKKDIVKAINQCLYDSNYLERVKNCSQPFGDATSWKKIHQVLSTVNFDEKLFDKKLIFREKDNL